MSAAAKAKHASTAVAVTDAAIVAAAHRVWDDEPAVRCDALRLILEHQSAAVRVLCDRLVTGDAVGRIDAAETLRLLIEMRAILVPEALLPHVLLAFAVDCREGDEEIGFLLNLAQRCGLASHARGLIAAQRAQRAEAAAAAADGEGAS